MQQVSGIQPHGGPGAGCYYNIISKIYKKQLVHSE